jgi:hypothetical protein
MSKRKTERLSEEQKAWHRKSYGGSYKMRRALAESIVRDVKDILMCCGEEWESMRRNIANTLKDVL